ncbi:glycine betaine ABC transporter substrate-binding protein [Microbacterium sp. G2-8]|uniref:glycine betaine ABC transporter substrate-binding protein n=1 Tax=Microbacterium sp. G2-8 TaxID=2842454 RepID=UPI001C8AB4E9|nr:glycine betaine ABC transporter substrate-binding protein [Microbacterium sp. G2-8]
MFTRKKALKIGAVIGTAGLAFSLASCASDGGAGDGGENDGAEDMGAITLGFIPSWTDGLSTAYLLENQLGKLGYTVEMEELTEAGPLYAGLAGGDVDMYPSAWPEVTHADYMDEFGDEIEDLGSYYDNAKLTITVPEYVDVDSIEDLAGRGEDFDGRIVGIEPGAGLTGAAESMIPEYGLEDEFSLETSSTAAMLAELEGAIENEEDIVVTLWRPFWPYGELDLKDLEDPNGAMGEPEALHFLGHTGFSDEFPEAADYIAGIQLDDVAYGALESSVQQASEDGEDAIRDAVDTWVSENGDAYETLITE